MTKAEIIEETRQYYEQDPGRRAVKLRSGGQPSTCVYFDPETHKMCAVGRCLKDPEKFAEEKVSIGYSNIEDTDFKKQYQGHDVRFWNLLQSFHDQDSNWSNTGLTIKGKNYYTWLLSIFK